jgi:hypothetical protein
MITALRLDGCPSEQALHQFFTGAAGKWLSAPAQLWRMSRASCSASIAAALAVAAATRLRWIKQLAHQLGNISKI